MFKNSSIMFLYAETSVHIGSGESFGTVDLAIQREKYTDFPICQSSGVKGAVRDWFEKNDSLTSNNKEMKIKLTFGPEEGEEFAGAASFTDARILLFPVKSLKGVFAWITCPFVLNRFKRDMKIVNPNNLNWNNIDNPNIGSVVVTEQNDNIITIGHSTGKIILEEYAFEVSKNNGLNNIVEWLTNNALPKSDEYKFWRDNLKKRFIIMNDDDFMDFVKNSTEVQTRIKLGKYKTTEDGGNLFYQENLPSDTLLYSLVFSQDSFGDRIKENDKEWGFANDIMTFCKQMDSNRIQIGGNESIGKGIMYVKFYNQNQTSETNEEVENG